MSKLLFLFLISISLASYGSDLRAIDLSRNHFIAYDNSSISKVSNQEFNLWINFYDAEKLQFKFENMPKNNELSDRYSSYLKSKINEKSFPDSCKTKSFMSKIKDNDDREYASERCVVLVSFEYVVNNLNIQPDFLSYININCKNKTYKTISTVINDKNYPNKSQKTEINPVDNPLPPGSPADQLSEILCK